MSQYTTLMLSVFVCFVSCSSAVRLKPVGLVNVAKCDLPKGTNYEEGVRLDVVTKESKGRYLFSAQLVVDHKIGPVWVNVSKFACKSNETKVTFSLDKANCRFPPLKIIYIAMTLRTTPNCELEPDTYTMRDFDVFKFSKHFFSGEKFDGKFLYRVHFYTRNGTVGCVETTME